MKRFWTVSEVAALDGKYGISLDGRPVKQADGAVLHVPFAALAEGIAREWAEAAPEFTLEDFPLTRLAATAQARVAPVRGAIIRQLAEYGMNDLLCYRSAAPPELVALEAEQWDPWLRWAECELGVALRCTAGILPIEQPGECRAVFTARLEEMSVYQLAGLGVIIPALGSLVLGLAVEAGALAAEAACGCANLGAIWQESRWGVDEDAAAGRARLVDDVSASTRFMALCRT
jgi:chaperone required for assembly of F1-ATPase